ncbi:MAG: thermonuclease family protein [Actinomycetota bacterium]|nr:thermonuclease family protein [Actinomycetota bacterium]
MRPLAWAPFVIVLVACSGAPATHAPDVTTVLTPNATLDRVVDGDTIDVIVDGVEERVRLIGIDTPETKKPNSPVECFGPEASAYTESLLPEGTPLYLERDVEPRDPYDRLLAYVYLADGTFVNLQIVRQGYAQVLTIPPNVAHAEQFVQAAREAEAADAGLWSGCSG